MHLCVCVVCVCVQMGAAVCVCVRVCVSISVCAVCVKTNLSAVCNIWVEWVQLFVSKGMRDKSKLNDNSTSDISEKKCLA